MKDLFVIDFRQVDEVISVIDGNNKIDIGNIPLWLSTIDVFVSKNSAYSLKFCSARQKKKNITIVNKENKPVISLLFDDNHIIVNSRYIIRKNGWIAYQYKTDESIDNEPNASIIKVINTEDVFKLRLRAWDVNFIFDVYPIGPIWVDPILDAAKKSVEDKSEIDASVLNAAEGNEAENNESKKQANEGTIVEKNESVSDSNKDENIPKIPLINENDEGGQNESNNKKESIIDNEKIESVIDDNADGSNENE